MFQIRCRSRSFPWHWFRILNQILDRIPIWGTKFWIREQNWHKCENKPFLARWFQASHQISTIGPVQNPVNFSLCIAYSQNRRYYKSSKFEKWLTFMASLISNCSLLFSPEDHGLNIERVKKVTELHRLPLILKGHISFRIVIIELDCVFWSAHLSVSEIGSIGNDFVSFAVLSSATIENRSQRNCHAWNSIPKFGKFENVWTKFYQVKRHALSKVTTLKEKQKLFSATTVYLENWKSNENCKLCTSTILFEFMIIICCW